MTVSGENSVALDTVLVFAEGHVRVLCGYSENAGDLAFVAHDDDLGPYVSHESYADDAPEGWEVMLAPVPADVILDPAAVEISASHVIHAFAARLPGDEPLLDAEDVAIRPVLVNSRKYKAGLARRGVLDEVRRACQVLQLPRHIWVAQVVDRRLRRADQPSVLGEVVFDSTSSSRDPGVLAVHYRGSFASQTLESPLMHGAAFVPYCQI